MKKLYILTGGLSLVTNIIDNLIQENDKSWIKIDKQFNELCNKNEIPDYIKEKISKISDKNTLINEINKYVNGLNVGIEKNIDKYSAEISSLLSLIKETPIDNSDEILILSSDTREGIFCAYLNALILSSANYIKILKKPGLGKLEEEQFSNRQNFICLNITETPIAIKIIKDYDPENIENLQDNGLQNFFKELTTVIINALNRGLDIEIIFTGGFKAGIPLITQVVSWLPEDINIVMSSKVEKKQKLLKTPIINSIGYTEVHKLILINLFEKIDISSDKNFIALKNKYSSEHNIIFRQEKYPNVFDVDPLAKSQKDVHLKPLGEALWYVTKELLNSKKYGEIVFKKLNS
ncbi:MAG: hypothetical protein CL609_23295 [Anaerolineaceae bacterium]|nr:hypothetical protein [Anaerolineaceae bacterium]